MADHFLAVQCAARSQFHSLMFVLLNGGTITVRFPARPFTVSLADVCVTEWRMQSAQHYEKWRFVSLADVCVTEWRVTLQLLGNLLQRFTR